MGTRRTFIKKLAAGSFAAMQAGNVAAALAPGIINSAEKKKDAVILFQGDSITDGNRGRNNDWNHILGHGYAYLIAARVCYDFSERNFDFYNRGVSGNKVSDLAERWQADALDIKPAVLSILAGVNDLEAFLQGDAKCDKENFESGYRSLLQRTQQALPAVQFVLCEPFILPVGRVKEKWALYSAEMEERQKIVRRLAVDFNAILVPCQKAFNKALQRADAGYWIWDGIHPMPAGHELIARLWLNTVKKNLSYI
ncbi:MAG: SGNH/GDSL hydrolase family protein [Chitinophagaceae bacterium]|nr:SGNH/GDSL hydrolase family protein [Chitinophagaceae bacterium]